MSVRFAHRHCAPNTVCGVNVPSTNAQLECASKILEASKRNQKVISKADLLFGSFGIPGVF